MLRHRTVSDQNVCQALISEPAFAVQSLMMDPDYKKFGRGPRELTGAVDLISHYKLLPHHDFFCKRPLPVSISDTHYLHNVVGDTEIRKGEGMQLGELIQDTSLSRQTNTRIQPFDLDILREAFQLRETAPVDLPPKRKHDGDEDANDINKHKKSKVKRGHVDCFYYLLLNSLACPTPKILYHSDLILDIDPTFHIMHLTPENYAAQELEDRRDGSNKELYLDLLKIAKKVNSLAEVNSRSALIGVSSATICLPVEDYMNLSAGPLGSETLQPFIMWAKSNR
ncbi:hypothetical protein BUALT_Bualt13G0108700 [Buddleja alternifolia]|uniref:Uncharacterized protein n=1 Tax=Buddleja alternifolia TaxID=168488 RepID=A0AAV6WXB2_9LAMI|nr:hypothetical protein BUALT_Bualt13G0108700 [Buddleja alternifolia]